MWLSRMYRVTIYQPQVFDAIGAAIGGQLFERRFLLSAMRYHELPAIPMRHVVRGAEFAQHPVAGDAQLRLERARRVIDTRMNHATVARARSHSEFRHLLDQENVAPALRNRTRYGTAHHAAADDHYVCAIHDRQDR